MQKRKKKLGMLVKFLDILDESRRETARKLSPEDEDGRFALYLLQKEYEAKAAAVYAAAVMNGIPMKTTGLYFPPGISDAGRKLFTDYIFKDLIYSREDHEQH